MDAEPDADTAEAATLFGLLGHPLRLGVVRALLDVDELTVRELNDRIPGSDNSLSQHLVKLRLFKLVTARRVGTTYAYRIADERLAAIVAAALRPSSGPSA